METIEFIQNTGISFYSPEKPFQFQEELMERSWNYRILKEEKANIAIFRESKDGSPLDNVNISGKVFEDAGGIRLCFGEILNCILGKWLPLPLRRKTSDANIPIKSIDWARIMFTRPELSVDEEFKFVIAVDTNVYPPNPLEAKFGTGLLQEDVSAVFEFCMAGTAFFQTTGIVNWIKSVFVGIPIFADDGVPEEFKSMVAYQTLIDGLRRVECLIPDISVIAPDSVAETNLILDLGNSRACGIISETTAGHQVLLDDCRPMQIRNLKDPTIVYTEPFSTSFKLYPPLFMDDEYKIPASGKRFLWPGFLRLGQEAAEMEQLEIGNTGMSSPKRYLWDDSLREYPWKFNLNRSDNNILSGPYLEKIGENGVFVEEGPEDLPLTPKYPASSMMAFAMVEILSHVYAQINSYSYRKSKGFVQTVRQLKNIVLTVPCGMSSKEQERYKEKIQNGLDMYFHLARKNKREMPQVRIELDEASAIQYTYLYGEIKNHFMGESSTALATLGKKRDVKGELKDVFRVASIDIGGGTSDLMISEFYNTKESGLIESRGLFSEGFPIAGDEIAKNIIRNIILKKVFNSIKEKNSNADEETFFDIFSESHAGRDKRFLDMKVELCHQVWIPMAMSYLAEAEKDDSGQTVEMGFDEFFKTCRRPSNNVMDFFMEEIRKEFNVIISLADIRWKISKKAINLAITNTMNNVLRIFSDVISQFSCDCLILGGKPSSLPAIREILLGHMPVKPSNIVCLKGYPAGKWYPFKQKSGGIADPKTTCVTGAAVWLFSEAMKSLEAMSVNSDNSLVKKRECFVGKFVKESMRMSDADIIFPSAKGRRAECSFSKTVWIGVRKIDSSSSEVNPIWEIDLDLAKHKGFMPPFKLQITQDAMEKDNITLEAVEDANGRLVPNADKTIKKLKTMVDEQYWLDTGSF